MSKMWTTNVIEKEAKDMKNKKIKTLFIIALTILFIALAIPKSLAINPGAITGEITGDKTIDVDFVESLENMIRLIGTFIAVGAMMIIGIKYMTGSIEEKANYKKTMMPYLIGCVLLFGASNIAPKIIETFKGTQTAEDIGNTALGLIQTIGTFVAVGILMILGIKYMLGSAEERSGYKKSMAPYIVGAILLFGAVNLTAMIANSIPTTEDTTKDQHQYDFSQRQCPSCGQNVEPRFDIDKHTYVCPRCGQPM